MAFGDKLEGRAEAPQDVQLRTPVTAGHLDLLAGPYTTSLFSSIRARFVMKFRH